MYVFLNVLISEFQTVNYIAEIFPLFIINTLKLYFQSKNSYNFPLSLSLFFVPNNVFRPSSHIRASLRFTISWMRLRLEVTADGFAKWSQTARHRVPKSSCGMHPLQGFLLHCCRRADQSLSDLWEGSTWWSNATKVRLLRVFVFHVRQRQYQETRTYSSRRETV